MNVFVTGGTGFLGTELVKSLIDKGHHVYVMVRSNNKASVLQECLTDKQRDFFHIIEGNLSEENLGFANDVIQLLKGKIDAVFHSAAYLSFDSAEQDKLFAINVEGTRRVLELAENLSVRKFFHISTAYTLGNNEEGIEALYPIEKTRFVNAYEETKCRAEHLVMSYKDSFDVTIMRPSIIIGDSQTGKANTTFGLYGVLRAVELLKKRSERRNMSLGKAFPILVEKEFVSNIVPVDYVVRLLCLGLEHGEKNTVYHLVNPSPPTNEQVMDVIKEALDFDGITLIPYQDARHLSDSELKFNQPLSVFKEYLNRPIDFQDNNTQKLLKAGNEVQLKMDNEMLLNILQGYLKRNDVLLQTIN